MLYMLLPEIINDDISLKGWLYARGLDGIYIKILIPYFLIAHPILEEIYWGQFRGGENRRWVMYVLFSGYHILVLWDLLSAAWLVISFLILILVAFIWDMLYSRLNGGIISFLSHFLGDLGIIWAVYRIVF